MVSRHTVSVRIAKPEDAPSIVEIAHLVQAEGYESGFHQGEDVINKLQEPYESLWVAEEDAQVVGFATAAFKWGKLHLTDLVVHPEARGRGIGRRLMERLIELGQEHRVSEVYLEVYMDNEPAVRLYRSLGFKERIAVRFLSRPFYGLYLPLEDEEGER